MTELENGEEKKSIALYFGSCQENLLSLKCETVKTRSPIAAPKWHNIKAFILSLSGDFEFRSQQCQSHPQSNKSKTGHALWVGGIALII